MVKVLRCFTARAIKQVDNKKIRRTTTVQKVQAKVQEGKKAEKADLMRQETIND